VIRPGGELRFYEHVIADKPLPARLQQIADATLWPRVAGGCHMARDTTAAIELAGFEIESIDRFPFSPGTLVPSMRRTISTFSCDIAYAVSRNRGEGRDREAAEEKTADCKRRSP